MNLAVEYRRLMLSVASRLQLPPVRRLYLPPTSDSREKNAEFGILELEDGSAGLVYLLLDDLRRRANDEIDRQALVGLSPLDLVEALGEPDPLARALAMGAVNAISQCLFSNSGFDFGPGCDILDIMRPAPGGRLGMVGYFPPLVERLREQGQALTVLELDPELVQSEGDFEVTLDAQRLAGCSHVICTATTLLNNSLGEILRHAMHAEVFALVGPTAGALPDPLFAAGIDIVAGSHVVDASELVSRCEADEKWGPAVEKYCLFSNRYPGVGQLLSRLDGA